MLLEGRTVEEGRVTESYLLIGVQFAGQQWPQYSRRITHTPRAMTFLLSEQDSSPEDFDKQLQPVSGEEWEANNAFTKQVYKFALVQNEV